MSRALRDRIERSPDPRGRTGRPAPRRSRRPDRAAHHLGAAGLRQRGREPHRRGRERLAELLGDAASRARRAARRRRRRRARATTNTHSASPFSSSGTPTAAASTTAGCATTTVSTSAGPSRLPASLIVSSERPCRNHWPSSSIDAQSPCHHTSGPARPVRLEVALRVVPQARASCPATASCTPARRPRRAPARPSSSNTSTAMPSAGPPSEHGEIGSTTCGDRKHAPTSVPPEMLITGQRPPPTTSKYQRHGPSFHGSPVDARTRSDDRSCASHGLVAVRHQRADERRRDAEHVDAVALDERPEPVGLRDSRARRRRARAWRRWRGCRRSPTAP